LRSLRFCVHTTLHTWTLDKHTHVGSPSLAPLTQVWVARFALCHWTRVCILLFRLYVACLVFTHLLVARFTGWVLSGHCAFAWFASLPLSCHAFQFLLVYTHCLAHHTVSPFSCLFFASHAWCRTHYFPIYAFHVDTPVHHRTCTASCLAHGCTWTINSFLLMPVRVYSYVYCLRRSRRLRSRDTLDRSALTYWFCTLDVYHLCHGRSIFWFARYADICWFTPLQLPTFTSVRHTTFERTHTVTFADDSTTLPFTPQDWLVLRFTRACRLLRPPPYTRCWVTHTTSCVKFSTFSSRSRLHTFTVTHVWICPLVLVYLPVSAAARHNVWFGSRLLPAVTGLHAPHAFGVSPAHTTTCGSAWTLHLNRTLGSPCTVATCLCAVAATHAALRAVYTGRCVYRHCHYAFGSHHYHRRVTGYYTHTLSLYAAGFCYFHTIFTYARLRTFAFSGLDFRTVLRTAFHYALHGYAVAVPLHTRLRFVCRFQVCSSAPSLRWTFTHCAPFHAGCLPFTTFAFAVHKTFAFYLSPHCTTRIRAATWLLRTHTAVRFRFHTRRGLYTVFTGYVYAHFTAGYRFAHTTFTSPTRVLRLDSHLDTTRFSAAPPRFFIHHTTAYAFRFGRLLPFLYHTTPTGYGTHRLHTWTGFYCLLQHTRLLSTRTIRTTRTTFRRLFTHGLLPHCPLVHRYTHVHWTAHTHLV